MFPSCNFGKKMFKIADTLKAKEIITNLLAFYPPAKTMYKISQIETQEKKENLIKGEQFDIKYEKVQFISDHHSSEMQYPWIEKECYYISRSKKQSSCKKLNGNERKKTDENSNFNGKKIVVLIIKLKNAQNNIIFSHGNASSIGTMYPTLIDIASQLKSNIICYDYQGYGHSQGSHSEINLYYDIENVLQFLRKLESIRLNESKDTIGSYENSFILIGQSLGSAPSVHIASKHCDYKYLIRAIILISPIASSVKIFDKKSNKNNIGLEKFDVFCNLKKIQEVDCPVFIIHGKKDDLIPISHSEEMLKYVKIHHKWFPKNGDHGNIFSKYRMKFITKCKIFLNNLNCFEGKKNNISRQSIENSNVIIKSDKTKKNNCFNAAQGCYRITNMGSITPFQIMNANPFDSSNQNPNDRGSYKMFNGETLTDNIYEGIALKGRAYENDLENYSNYEENNYLSNFDYMKNSSRDELNESKNDLYADLSYNDFICLKNLNKEFYQYTNNFQIDDPTENEISNKIFIFKEIPNYNYNCKYNCIIKNSYVNESCKDCKTKIEYENGRFSNFTEYSKISIVPNNMLRGNSDQLFKEEITMQVDRENLKEKNNTDKEINYSTNNEIKDHCFTFKGYDEDEIHNNRNSALFKNN